MFSNYTIFGTPDYLEKVKEDDFTLNTDNDSINNISEIMKILENTDVDELDNVQIKYELEDDIIYAYKLKKDKLLLEYICEKNYKKIYNRLENLEVIPKRNLYKNAYSKILKIQAGDEEPTPQSVVWLVVFAVGVAVYGVIVHSAGEAVNVGAGANLWVQVSIKFDVYGYSVKKQDERVKNIAYTLFPDLKNIDNLLNEFFDNNEKIELMKYILTESSKKLKSELRNNDEYFKGIERWGLI